MTNIEKLQSLNILGDIRKRQGATNEYDDSFDAIINEMTNYQLIEKFCEWHLGGGGWWETFKQYFDALEKMDNTNENQDKEFIDFATWVQDNYSQSKNNGKTMLPKGFMRKDFTEEIYSMNEIRQHYKSIFK